VDISLLHQTQTKRKMKATTIILATVLSLSMNVLFAGNDGVILSNETISVMALAPSTPSEATFEDMTSTATINLAPVTPNDADFSDVAPELTVDLSALAPVTPGEADFSSEELLTTITINLAPVTPSVADFTETI
jgi:hypothetical protein